MQGGQVGKGVVSGQQLIGDGLGLGEFFAAVNHAVANCVDLFQAVYHFILAGGEQFSQFFKSLGVGGEVAVQLNFSSIGQFVDNAAVDADSLTEALGQDRLVGHVHQLVFQGRTACVDNQYFHRVKSSYYFLQWRGPRKGNPVPGLTP